MNWMLMPLRRYAEFSGRSRRMEYWMFGLFIFLVYAAFGMLLIVLGAGAFTSMGVSGSGATVFGGGAMIVGGLCAIFGLAVIVPSIAVAIRRLHDTDRSGWLILAPLAGYPIQIAGAVMNNTAIAMIGSLISLGLGIMLVVFYFMDGTSGPNRYGADPKDRGEAVPAY